MWAHEKVAQAQGLVKSVLFFDNPN
jgi:hypothetical protein